jgi:ATP-dependent RNA helicase MSS116
VNPKLQASLLLKRMVSRKSKSIEKESPQAEAVQVKSEDLGMIAASMVRDLLDNDGVNIKPEELITDLSDSKGQRTTLDFSTLQISENTKRALSTVMKFTSMTRVQAEAIPEVLKGNDVFVKSKTGTGKTLAFLIPGIEMLLKELQRHAKDERAAGRGDSSVPSNASPLLLVLSPTRELAMQIAEEAKTLLTFHRLNVLTLVGGVDVSRDVRALTSKPFDIIVATPGRLLMHLEDSPGVARRLASVKFLVLDEADRLLDMGFKRDINKISSYLPSSSPSENKKARQTLLFSATFSDEIKEVVSKFLRKQYSVIDTVGQEVEQTHQHVSQKILSVKSGNLNVTFI